MKTKNGKLWLQNQQLRLKQDEVNTLREELEIERICIKIERILHQKEVDKLYNTTLNISRDFMEYCENHPSDVSDSDVDDDEFEPPDEPMKDTISLRNFCQEFNWNAGKVEEIQEVFGI